MSEDLVIPSDFKSTLPPRKRARTQEEKEQRKIERILRNRRAAHQSREKKRVHLQRLEQKCKLMESLLGRIDDLDGLIRDKKGKDLLKQYRSFAASDDEDEYENENQNGSCDKEETPSSGISSESVSSVKSESEAGLVQLQTPENYKVEEDTGISEFAAPTDLTPVSFVNEDPKSFNLVLTNNGDSDTLAPSQPLQPVWLGVEDDDDGSFEFDDWRNPAVIAVS
ncbi:hypothetical protein ZYGR_0S00270 [Zygosaccharomyces rouxii]|uniref:ZYRO0F03102p n=2 Tax=Zygosaccharomyces rouxii TaxID=4956 RepID=C5DX88_ZYGRC|nr:uncharacterized protein ZYRO0F03102g [Zygosaccharomyces rouxii]KAH9199163.1 hypothetical protein LQ764DRAFT_235023 [Zygosaccharomyces rouxii]GAV49895.1 hypothetical protein ZYGR_0S00270 [Zygosaccharomyces rouxii]CAR28399.1 ZYRO0F03102p [Zygosaccharomyces rouxii]